MSSRRYKTNNIIVCSSDDGDWQGLYINDKLFRQGHAIRMGDWVDLINEYHSFGGIIAEYDISRDIMEDMGHLPDDFHEIPKEFLK